MEGWFSLCLIALGMPLALGLLKLAGGKKEPQKHQLPPGPWTLPIIGSLHHVVSLVPHRKITQLCRRYGPMMHLKLGEVDAVVVSSAEAVAQVMKTNDLTFATRPGTPTQDIAGCGGRGIIFAPYGDHWRQMRKVCIVELLSSMQVRRMDSIRPEEVGNLLADIATAAAAGDSINISEKMMELSNNVVSRAVFGGRFTQQDEYIRELDVVLTLLGGFCLVDLFPSSRLARWLSFGARRMKKSYGRMQRIIADVIEERKAARAAAGGASSTDDEDLLDVLLRLQNDDSLAFPLTTDSICAVLFDIFSGATDTTGTILEWAMSELVRHPKTMFKAQLEIRKVLGEDRTIIKNSDLGNLHYMRMVIKEVLRLHLPAPLIPRMARMDCKIMSYELLKGATILINVFAVSRDPKYWKHPEAFLPERFENNNLDYNGTHFEFIPFGAGRRQCPGMLFGASTLEITLANLLYHFDWVLPDGASPESLDMSEKFGMTVGRSSDLQLIAIPRGCIKDM
ncbi:desmethyl-deoxy-podophyllotoxin synthase-like [Triticum urartu]|uniref:Cytochrome P450 71D7 n=1 Tax=Triticum urartu TaxID=4572 RepID=A0A8R7TBH1_TRIUA|nr:desmethyl-deoxy-podophyllotoxin synthase-like [Triticum urartu]